jgi:hypothetical protein
MCNRDLVAGDRLSRQTAHLRALARITAFPVVGCGAVSVLSGATGHNFASRLFTGGLLSPNDAVPGAVLLAVGLFLLHVTGDAPLWEQARAIRHWGSRQWISIGLVVTGFVALLALDLVEALLSLPRWMHYGFSGLTTLIFLAGALLWPIGPNRSAPLSNQLRAMRHWGRRQWVSAGLVVTGLAAFVALSLADPLWSMSWWIHFPLFAAATLVMIAGCRLWPNGQDRSAQS